MRRTRSCRPRPGRASSRLRRRTSARCRSASRTGSTSRRRAGTPSARRRCRSRSSRPPGLDALIWRRTFSSSDVALWVVKMLATAMSERRSLPGSPRTRSDMSPCMFERKNADWIRLPAASLMPVVTTRMYVVCWRRSWSDSTCSVFVAGSHAIWLIPVTLKSGRLIRNTFELLTLAGSIGARERDRDPRLHVEAVERVEDVDIGAVGRAHGAVRLRQLDAKTGVLRPVERRPAIAREWAALRARQVERPPRG